MKLPKQTQTPTPSVVVSKPEAGKAPAPLPKQITRSLPTKKSTPATTLEGISAIIYGERKIGKSSLLAEFEDSLSLMCDPGGNFLEVYKQNIGRWEDLMVDIKLLDENRTQFRHVSVDTTDAAYSMVCKYIRLLLNIKQMSEVAYGGAWGMATDEFINRFRTLMATGRSVFFLSHIGWGTFKDPNGTERNRFFPTLNYRVSEWLSGTVDLIACYTYFGDERHLVIEGSQTIEAGHRLKGRFMTPKGERVRTIPMGTSSEEAYENFMRAFNNKQDIVGIYENPTIKAPNKPKED